LVEFQEAEPLGGVRGKASRFLVQTITPHSPRAALDPSRHRVRTWIATSRSKFVKSPRKLTEGQRAYEARRAAKAGLSLEKWLAAKERDRLAEEKAKAKAVAAAQPAKPPGLFKRLLERAHKPLGSRKRLGG
jgi:hypothetical protein